MYWFRSGIVATFLCGYYWRVADGQGSSICLKQSLYNESTDCSGPSTDVYHSVGTSFDDTCRRY
jgi:hypothetical protein